MATCPAGSPLLLFDFAMKGATLQRRVVFKLFDFVGLLLEVARCHIARGRFAFFARFRAFDDYYFSWHFDSFLKVIKQRILPKLR